MIKAALFDLDDTLLRTIDAKWAHHKAVAKEFYDVDLSDDVLAEHWGKPITVMMQHFYNSDDTGAQMLEKNRSMDHLFPKGVYDQAVDVIKGLLDAGMEVGIVTSTMTDWARRDLERLGFPADRLFIIQGEDAHHARKPDPAVFEPAFQLLKAKSITPDEVAYVGDSLFDLHAALSANILFIGVTTGLISAEVMRSEGARHVVADIAEVLPILLNG